MPGRKMVFRDRGDGKDRASIPVWLRLTKGQLKVVKDQAEAAGKRHRVYLRDIAEAAIEQMIPAEGD